MTTEPRSTKRNKKLLPLEPAPTQLSKQKTLDLPVDVWFMIAEQAHPYPLLQLSRTNKFLRRILTSKESSSGIWDRAYRDLEDFLDFENSEFGGPSLVAFIYEDCCAVCKKGGTDRESHSMRIRLHSESCIDKLILQGRKLLLKIPAIRDEVLLCTPKAFFWDNSAWEERDRQYSCSFVIDEARKVNFDLHDHLSSSKGQDEATAIGAFIEGYQPRAESMEEDGENLSDWMEVHSRVARRRIANALSSHCHVNLKDTKDWLAYTIGRDWQISIRASLVSVQGWNKLYYKIEKLFLSHCEPAEKAQKRQQVKRRKLLYTHYDTLKGDDPFYPPFSIFTELPSIRKLWEPVDARNYAIEDKWDSQQLQDLETELLSAQRWIRLSLARILSRSLAQLGKPLSPQLYSSLHPEDCLLPPPSFSGIGDSSSSTGLYLDDPATTSATKLGDLLDRFSNQAWSLYDYEQPRPLASTLRDILDHINIFEYEGPLFPKFNKFWHQVLSQVLEKSGVEDGPQGDVKQRLEELGSCFSCRACEIDREETELMPAFELLKHFKRHTFPVERTPQDSLVVFHAAEAQENAGLVENSDEAIP